MKNTLTSTVIVCILACASCRKNSASAPAQDPSVTVQSFVRNAGITDSSQILALNNFVSRLNQSSLWSKFIAIYPMMGGTAGSTMWNLKDPRDLDEAYRLTFYGSPQVADTGIFFHTIADYADTHILDSKLPYNNNSISYYSLSQNDSSGYDMGCSDHVSPFNEFGIYHNSDATEWFGFHALAVKPVVTKGLFIVSATSSDVKRYDNGVMTISKGAAPEKGYTNLPVLIGNVASDTLCGQKVCAFATVGYGLSDQDVAAFYQIVQSFQADLKRD